MLDESAARAGCCEISCFLFYSTLTFSPGANETKTNLLVREAEAEATDGGIKEFV